MRFAAGAAGAGMSAIFLVDQGVRLLSAEMNRWLNTDVFTQNASAGGLMYPWAVPVVFALGVACLACAVFWKNS